MAKSTTTAKPAPVRNYPSLFGSHSSMICEELTTKLVDPTLVILKDDDGYYMTKKDRLDTGGADPYRWTTCEHKVVLLKSLFPKANIYCLDCKVIFEENNETSSMPSV